MHCHASDCRIHSVSEDKPEDILSIFQAILHFPGLDQTDKMLEGSVVGGLGGFCKAATRQLPHVQVIGNALAAGALSGTGLIGALAGSLVLFLEAFHGSFPPYWCFSLVVRGNGPAVPALPFVTLTYSVKAIASDSCGSS